MKDLPKPQKDLPLPEKDLPASRQELPASITGNKFKFQKKGIFVFLVLIFIFSLIISFFIYSKMSIQNELSQKRTVENVQPKIDDFFIISNPRDLKNITVHDLPDSIPRYAMNVMKIDNSLWVGGEQLIEYDASTGAILSHTNPRRAICGRFEYVNGFIYVSCSVKGENISKISDNELDFGEITRNVIIKIDPKNHEFIRKYGMKDGLKSNENLKLFKDEDYLWISSKRGLGRVKTKSDELEYFIKELGEDYPSIGTVLIDEKYVWASIEPVEKSSGGLVLFDKTTERWKRFYPKDINDYNHKSFSLGFIKSIPSGVQIAFIDGENGENRLVEKQYDYKTKEWVKLKEQRVYDEIFEEYEDLVESDYKLSEEFSFIENSGIFQIKQNNTGEIFNINGRSNLIISEEIEGKRYILTQSTIDLIDKVSPFSRIFIKLGENINDVGESSKSDLASYFNFLIEPTSMYALAIYSGCHPIGYCGASTVWLVDLNAGKIIKKYTENNNTPNGDRLTDPLTINLSGNSLIIENEDGEIFRVDLNNYSLIPIITPSPIPLKLIPR